MRVQCPIGPSVASVVREIARSRPRSSRLEGTGVSRKVSEAHAAPPNDHSWLNGLSALSFSLPTLCCGTGLSMPRTSIGLKGSSKPHATTIRPSAQSASSRPRSECPLRGRRSAGRHRPQIRAGLFGSDPFALMRANVFVSGGHFGRRVGIVRPEPYANAKNYGKI
jgi:hypothetical protein